MKILAPLALGLLLVTACNKPVSDPATAVATGSARWKATDACALVDKAAVAAAAGSKVTKAELTGVTPAHDGLAALSTCIYTLADGASVGVLAREAPDGDMLDQSVESARTGGGVMTPPEEVAGLGRAAFWAKDLNSLQVFLDDRRYLAVNVSTPPAGSDPKAIATAVAKAAG